MTLAILRGQGGDQTAFHCPSFNRDDLEEQSGKFDAVFSYGYNLWLDHPPGQRQADGGSDHGLPRIMNLSYIGNPSMLVVFGEVAHTDYDNMAAKHIVYRHGDEDSCNIAFADGHAKSYTKEDVFVAPGESKAKNKTVVWDPEKPLVEESAN